MNEFLLALRQFFRGFRCWIIISPWEKGLRVRKGKKIKVLDPGIHLKLPILDALYLQSIRIRLSPLNKQTLSTASGTTITLAASFSYCIEDIEKLYTTIHHAEDTIVALIRSKLADYVSSHVLEDCNPETIQKEINKTLDFSMYGLGNTKLFITEFAIVKTYRIIGDHGEYAWGKRLSTDAVTTSSSDPT